jgi:peptidoglycan hydrolase-like protein with peptidoglycan-binding domain
VAKITKSDFVAQLTPQRIDINQAKQDARLAGVDLTKSDLNHDGAISGDAEAAAVFKQLDGFDHDGNAQSIALTTASGAATQAGGMVHALTDLLPKGLPVLADTALTRGLAGKTLPLASGEQGQAAVAVQYTLARLGFQKGVVDGKWGPGNTASLKAFQASSGLPATGALDKGTLVAMDTALTRYDAGTPASHAADPLGYLSKFSDLGVSKVVVTDTSKPITWSNPEIQKAYGTFVGEYWQAMKTNKVESDCKTLNLFFMDQFRAKVKQDTGVQLPLPSSNGHTLPQPQWKAYTATNDGGYFQRTDQLKTVRPGYEAATMIEKLDPKFSLLEGVNLRYGNVSADQVAQAATQVTPWSTAAYDNGGDQTKIELPLNTLQPGMVVFLDHQGDGKFDHAVNIVGVDRGPDGKVTTVRVATGSYDDMKDELGSTVPNGLNEVDNYTEEVEVKFDAAGKVASSQVTWSSEPTWVTANRYSARTTLMELHPGSAMKLARWG